MRVYFGSKAQFLNDVLEGDIEETIAHDMKRVMGTNTSANEKRSWHNSLEFMYTVLMNSNTPDDCGIAIEYNIPCSNLRADFIITGMDSNDTPTGVIIELKQWEKVKQQSDSHRMVTACYRDGTVWQEDMLHPSYQSWSYAEYMRDTLKVVQEHNVNLFSCSFLHNCIYESGEVLIDTKYSSFIDGESGSTPYVETDVKKLIDFIDSHIVSGDFGRTIELLDKSDIQPSKDLMKYVGEIMNGNPVFNLIDDQMIIYEKILRQYRLLNEEKNSKYYIIVHGGPGTGKSVIALSLMAHIISKYGKMSRYVTTNATPRKVYETIMKEDDVKKDIRCLFEGASNFVKMCKNDYDGCKNVCEMSLVDEAHRLAPKDTLFNSKIGQIQAVLHGSRFTVFFLDEEQHVFVEDDGNVENIKKWAIVEGVKQLPDLFLKTQFRCGGSNGYIDWLYSTLQKENSHKFDYRVPYRDYDIKITEDPMDIVEWIDERYDPTRNNARIVAGYCWSYESKDNPNKFDIELGNKGFKMKWNDFNNKYSWALIPDGINQVGAVHTCQGLEFDYVGVIIGKDMTFDGKRIVCRKNHPRSDTKTFNRLDKLYPNPIDAEREIDRIVKNTYSVLMTRGKLGCRVYCEDKGLKEYFRTQIAKFHEKAYRD